MSADPVVIKINGVDYTGRIVDLSCETKDTKSTATNIKGDGLTIPARSSEAGNTIKLGLYYLVRDDYLALNTLYEAGAPVALALTGFEISGDNYIIIECTAKLIKSLDAFRYNVNMTLQQDKAPSVPQPVLPAKQLLTVVQKLGW